MRDVTHRVANHRRKPSIASTTRNMRTRPSSGSTESRVNRLGESSKVTRVICSPPAKFREKSAGYLRNGSLNDKEKMEEEKGGETYPRVLAILVVSLCSWNFRGECKRPVRGEEKRKFARRGTVIDVSIHPTDTKERRGNEGSTNRSKPISCLTRVSFAIPMSNLSRGHNTF